MFLLEQRPSPVQRALSTMCLYLANLAEAPASRLNHLWKTKVHRYGDGHKALGCWHALGDVVGSAITKLPEDTRGGSEFIWAGVFEVDLFIIRFSRLFFFTWDTPRKKGPSSLGSTSFGWQNRSAGIGLQGQLCHVWPKTSLGGHAFENLVPVTRNHPSLVGIWLPEPQLVKCLQTCGLPKLRCRTNE